MEIQKKDFMKWDRMVWRAYKKAKFAGMRSEGLTLSFNTLKDGKKVQMVYVYGPAYKQTKEMK